MPLAFSTSSKMSTNFFSTILTHHPPQTHPNRIFPFQKSLKNFIRQPTPTASLFYQLATPQILTMYVITFQKWNNFQNSVTNSSLNFCNFNNCEKSAFCLSIFYHCTTRHVSPSFQHCSPTLPLMYKLYKPLCLFCFKYCPILY